ncbi:MAG: c-type cytochrome domain-containing protein, partial [Planctomycetota bacterium]
MPAASLKVPSVGRLLYAILATVVSLGIPSSASRVSAQEVDFANDIQTVLSRRCYACHGPDQQEGGLRFDQRETLLVEADTGEIPVVPGDPAKSELIRRITSEDESERMPPEGKPLTEEEVRVFKAWIADGAKYEQHWAFQPVQSSKPPAVKNPAWARAPMDRFVLAKLESAKLSPVAQASPEKLIRR